MHAGVDVEQFALEPARGGEPVRLLTERLTALALTSPDRVAVVSGDVSLSFAELDQLSNVVATSVGAAGIAADACVALAFERSARFLVAALGVMKSGAAYLPIDPGTPAARIEFILKDAAVGLLLTDVPAGGLPTNPAWREIRIDSFHDLEKFSAAPASAKHSPARPSDLAYVIYTSGSTGEPKGVEITHANLANLIDWHIGAFELKAGDRASAVAGFGFDAAVWEIWPALAAGVTLHIADEKTRRSPQALRDWLVSQQINVAFVPTVMTEQLMQLPWPEGTRLRYLLTGADTLHRRPPADAPFRLVNNYGPTECTVVATSGIVTPDNGDGTRLDQPSIGRAISNTTALILDNQLRPLADGETGELCLAGSHVGRGYRNRPEMTSQRFVTCAVNGTGQLRVYRTGDRAKVLPSGEIAFLGRLDEQVKIRGYRVELGEIASTLDRHPAIEASVVVARDGESGPELIAYVVSAAAARVSAAELNEFAAKRLPDYMLPAKYVTLPSLPQTLNGKLDRAALPEPSEANLLVSGKLTEQKGSETNTETLEARVGNIVGGLLGKSSVGRDDNFFMLGGHSMLGVQLAAKLRDAFGVKLTLRQLFTAPTVAALSAEVARLTDANKS